jgi:hypothetical protein
MNLLGSGESGAPGRAAVCVFVSALLLAGLLASGCANQTSPEPPPATPPPPPPVAAATSYVDCSAATNGTGTQASPWNTLATVDATTFNPGDKILFNRGTTCEGMLSPNGSGTTASPIVVDAYGTGAQPIIDGGMNNAAVALSDQQGWEINNLEIVGGNQYGVYIFGPTQDAAYTHFRLTNLNIHGAHYVSTTVNDSGEVFISIGNAGVSFSDIVIDGVTVHDSTVNDGIFIDAGTYSTSAGTSAPGSNITIQNSSVYDVYGMGMTLFVVNNGLMQNNVVHNTGQCPPNPGCGSGTPGGLMDLYCENCVIQNNEAYSDQDWSPWDGGDYDIDVWSSNNIVQYNYGHDSVGYCVSDFSADNVVSSNNVIRYNICANDAQLVNSPDPGEIFLNTAADGVNGSISGLEIYNNTFFWNPATPAPAFNTSFATYSGSVPNLFQNNIIYSTVPYLIETTSDFALDNNIYWTVGAKPDWNFNGTDYTDLVSYQSASGQDAMSLFSDPMMNTPTYHAVGRPVTAFTLLSGSPALGAGANVCSGLTGCSMGTQDFWGDPLPNGSGYNIGAWQ